MKFNKTIEVDVTPDDFVGYFCNSSAEDQAMIIETIVEVFVSWKGNCGGLQALYVKDIMSDKAYQTLKEWLGERGEIQ